MRMTSISWPQVNSIKKSAPSAEVVELSFLTPERVDRISSTGLVISFSICDGWEFGYGIWTNMKGASTVGRNARGRR